MYSLLEVLKEIKTKYNAKYVVYQGYQRPSKSEPLITDIDIAIKKIENNPDYENLRSDKGFDIKDERSISFNGTGYFMSFSPNEENYPIKQRIESYEKCKVNMKKEKDEVPLVAYRMQEKVLNK